METEGGQRVVEGRNFLYLKGMSYGAKKGEATVRPVGWKSCQLREGLSEGFWWRGGEILWEFMKAYSRQSLLIY